MRIVSCIGVLLASILATSCGGGSSAGSAGRTQLFVASVESGRLEVFDTATLRRVQVLEGSAPLAELAATPDASRVFGSSPSVSRLLVIRRSSLSIDRILDLPAGPRRMAASPDGKLLWVSCELAAALAPIELPSVQHLGPVPIAPGPHVLAIVPGGSGHEVYASNPDDDTLSIVDAVSRLETRRLPLDAGSKPNWLVHAPADASVWTGSRSGELYGMSAGVHPQVLATRIDLGSPPGRIALNPANDQHLWVLLPALDRLTVVDAVTRSVFPGGRDLPTESAPQRLAFGKDGRAALVLHEAQATLLAIDSDPASPTFLARLGIAALGPGRDRRIALEPNRKRVWIGSPEAKLVELFDSDPDSPRFLQRLGQLTLEETPGAMLVAGPGGAIPTD